MKMGYGSVKNIFLAAITLIVLGCGCETNRSVNVIVPRAEDGGAGISATEGLHWFRDIASQCNLDVSGPHILSDELSEYYAGLSTEPSLILWLYPKKIEFEVSFYGTAKEAPKARETAKSFTDKLNERQIPYKVREWVAIPPP